MSLAVVTGGNRGIGLEVCRKLVSSGHNVLLCSRDAQAGRAAAEEVSRLTGRLNACTAHELDVAQGSSIRALAAHIAGQGEQVEVLVNNAGVYPDGWSRGHFEEAVGTNFSGAVELTQELLPHMKQGGKVVMVSSGYGKLDNLIGTYYRQAVERAGSIAELQAIEFRSDDPMAKEHGGPYKISKAMLNHAVQLLARDPQVVQRGLEINAICPGWCSTRMGGSSGTSTPEQGADSVVAVLQPGFSAAGGFFSHGKAKEW